MRNPENTIVQDQSHGLQVDSTNSLGAIFQSVIDSATITIGGTVRFGGNEVSLEALMRTWRCEFHWPPGGPPYVVDLETGWRNVVRVNERILTALFPQGAATREVRPCDDDVLSNRIW